MNKELEVLIKNSKNIVDKYEEWAIGEIKKFADKNEWSLKLMSDFIEKAITPPTSEEVCKALSEWFRKSVIYNSKLSEFSFDEPKKRGYIYYIACKSGRNIRFNYELPPHLITLIGRFYEGVIK